MPTDPQLQLLTHYALGELPAERLPEVEALLADDAEARAWLATVRRTAAALGAELAVEAGATAGLDAGRKAAIARAAAPARPPLRLRPWMVLAGGLAAAGLVAAVVIPGVTLARRSVRPAPVTVLPVNGDAPQASAPMAAAPPVTTPQLMPLPPDEPDPEVRVVAGRALPQPRAEEQSDLVAKCEVSEPAEPFAPVGREVAVANSEMGGSGAFMAIGSAAPKAGMFGARDESRSAGSWESERKAPQQPVASAQRPAASSPQPAATGLRYGGLPPQPPVLGAPASAPGESYAPTVETGFQDPRRAPLSTFGLDVDTASYANVRRFIEQGRLPPPEAVRIEEMLNAFAYADPPPAPGSDRPFAVRVELAECPWAPAHRLARIAVAATPVEQGQRPPCNLVFLVDVSGSMDEPNKLALVKRSLAMLTGQLRAEDRVAIVTYSSTTRLALASTPGSERGTILRAVESLSAAGSTNGAAGIQLAYQTAQANAVAGVNRVILCTDGDFNVGVQSPAELQRLIEEKRRSGVTLTVLGFGMGNLKDANLQILADKGDGTYAYIDSEAEAHQALVRQLDRHLVMVAKDAKVQVEFNPAIVANWRLIGYEKRQLRAQDFADDRVDSGDVGAGAHVTALYELETRPSPIAVPQDGLRYQGAIAPAEERWDAEVMFVKLRWKRPDLDRSELLRFPVVDRGEGWAGCSADFRFAAAVASFGLTLRNSPWRGGASLSLAEALARGAVGEDADGQRRGFVELVRQAMRLGQER